MGNGGILNGLVVGWQDVEPILLACIAAKMNVILRGKHGTSKTIFAKLVAQALGGTYRHYDATKDDMVSVAGIPNPEDLKKGILSFSKHDRAIWEADYISIDELTRAPRESQNMWLEILEEKTCTGFALKYHMALATMNPATYNATYRLDEALLDRFAALVDIPEVVNAKVDPQDIFDIVKMNINGKRGHRNPQDIARLGEAIQLIAEHYHSFAENEDIVTAVCNYVKIFGGQLVKADQKVYISPRRFIHLANCLMACAAYYKFAQGHGTISLSDGMFAAGAKMAITHVIAAPLNLSAAVVKVCHEKAVAHIKNLSGDQSDKLLVEINQAKHLADKVDVLAKNLDIVSRWSSSEVGSIFNTMTGLVTETTRNIVAECVDGGQMTRALGTESKRLGQAMDKLQQLYNKILGSSTEYSTAMYVAAKNNAGALIAQRVKLMTGFANYVSRQKGQTEIVTYAQITANNMRTGDNLWEGNLINNSVGDTIASLLKEL